MPTIETERLILRPPAPEDLPGWTAMVADEEASRFFGGPKTANEAWGNLCLFAGAWTIRGFGHFSVIEKASGRFIGRAGPWHPVGWPGEEIGWFFDRSVWGRGFATEAATACLGWAFDVLGWERVVHVIAPDNHRSIRVAERIGSVLIGPGKMPPPRENATVLLYGQDRPRRG